MLNTYPVSKFIFHGEGREYFKIWIVNLVLTIATLGIYAAWAKVRTRKYFYQCTELNGNRFDYHGEPKAILKGNLLVAAIALAYVASSAFAPTLSAFIVLSVMCLMPFFLVTSLRFHLANCSFRGLRFAFNGSVKTAYGKLVVAILISLSCFLMVSILYAVANGFFDFEFNAAFSSLLLIAMAILPIVSISLIAAVFISGLRLFVMNNIKFGNADLSCNVGFAQFSKVTLKSVSLAGAAMLLLAIVALVVNVSVFTGLVDFALPTASEPATLQDEAAQEQAQVAMQAKAILSSMGIIAVLGYLVLFIMGAYLKTAVDNLVWNNTMLANQHQFRSTASPMAATWIHMSNIVLIALTIGLFLPFARIRSARYRIAHMTFQPVGSIDEIVRIEQAKQTVFGDSMSDALGLELGI
jgi:uncharacterized membrane protein YjgN (DUF898 family)